MKYFKEKGLPKGVFGISTKSHINCIEVYRDEELRDKVLNLLNSRQALLILLSELSDYFDKYADVDAGQPNKEMHFYTAIENLLEVL